MTVENSLGSKVFLCVLTITAFTLCLIYVSLSNQERDQYQMCPGNSDITNGGPVTYNINGTSDMVTASNTTAVFDIARRRENGEVCEKRLPKIIMVGSMKSGTTALISFLNHHPQIAACRSPDEPRFFTKYYEGHSFEWYRNLMPCSFSNQLTMEKTPGYFYQNTTALRIKKMNDKMIILVMFKDPVEVAISIYAMWKAHHEIEEGKEFKDMVTKLDSSGSMMIDTESEIIGYCKYIIHTQLWVDVFGKKQVYAIDGSSYDKHPLKELQLLESFLGIKPFFKKSHFVFGEKKNKYCFAPDKSKTIKCLPPGKGRAHPEVPDEVLNLLREYFKPYNAQLSKLMKRTFIWQ